MLTATISYSKFEIIHLQREDSEAKSNVIRKIGFYFGSAGDIGTAITNR